MARVKAQNSVGMCGKIWGILGISALGIRRRIDQRLSPWVYLGSLVLGALLFFGWSQARSQSLLTNNQNTLFAESQANQINPLTDSQDTKDTLFTGFQISQEVVPGQYVIQIKSVEGLTTPTLRDPSFKKNLETTLGGQILNIIPDSPIVLLQVPNEPSAASTLARLKLLPTVELAEPNFLYRTTRRPNDPDLPKLWGLSNSGQSDTDKTTGIVGVDIGALKAWDIETGSRNIIVAIIDTGLDYTLPDLKANAWVNQKELFGTKGIDDDQNGYIDDIYGSDFANNDSDPMDDNGHGSHVAGTIGASGNDGTGIVGVNWQVRMMGLKFMDANGSGSAFSAIEAIKYATKMKANIMSNSWGGGGFSQIMLNAIREANQQNILFVAAAGNHSKNNDLAQYYPANYDSPNVVSVAAINNRGLLADFSGFGPKSVHIAAPGVNIYSCTPKSYQSWSGTSMATPHVAGVAALVLAHEPNLTASELRERLIRTATSSGKLKSKVLAGGVVNAYNALLNQVSPPDRGDPANWSHTKSLSISSAHPYSNNTHQVWEFEAPGARTLALYFSDFDTETTFDTVALYDRQGKLIEEASGPIGPHWSGPIPGDYVKVVFNADGVYSALGFSISKGAYQP